MGRKKLYKSVRTCALDALEGFVAVNDGVRRIGGSLNVVREDLSDLKGKVALVAGISSGHEPFAAGCKQSL
jgi:dihydroxyacetone kinase